MPLAGRDGDLSNDDYIARILTEEARGEHLRYATQGLGAYMPRRATSGAPKPNTRFLRNIIRDTDNHNASLKRREEREARERTRRLRGDVTTSAGLRDQEGRRRHKDVQEDHDRYGNPKERRHSHKEGYRSRSLSTDPDRSRRHRHRHSGHGTNRDRHKRHSRRDKQSEMHNSKRSKLHSRSRSGSPRHEHRETRAQQDRSDFVRRSIYPERQPSRSPNPSKNQGDNSSINKNRHRSLRQQDSFNISTKSKDMFSPATAMEQSSGYESDPLEDLIGPKLPEKDSDIDTGKPVRSRGRGAYRPKIGGIDAHFAPDYDPSLDVSLEDNVTYTVSQPGSRAQGLSASNEDWELTLEALRDRTRWRQKGEGRLREAGFSDSIVERWKASSVFTVGDQAPKSIESVKWSKRGEGREWDRGKYIDEKGSVDVKAGW